MKKILISTLFLTSISAFAATDIQIYQCEVNTYIKMIDQVAEMTGIQPQNGQPMDKYLKYVGEAQALTGNDQAFSKSVHEACVKLFGAAESVK